MAEQNYIEYGPSKADLVRHLFTQEHRYDPETGEFFWREKKLECIDRNGFLTIHLLGRQHRGQNIAWMLIHGETPKTLVTHADGNKLRNTPDNLIQTFIPEELTQEWLLSVFTYDPETGEVRRKRRISRKHQIGELLTSDSTGGYYKVGIGPKEYALHRVIWLMMTGKWPEHFIDHKNGNGKDNRWENLRDVTPQVNAQNQREARSDNTCKGLLGVSYHKHSGKYTAQIKFGKKIHLGTFSTPEEAHAVYLEAKRRLHPGCTI